MNINSAINEGISILKKGLISTAQLDCELLMSKIIKKDRKDIILNQNKKLNLELYESFKFLIYERLKKNQSHIYWEKKIFGNTNLKFQKVF